MKRASWFAWWFVACVASSASGQGDPLQRAVADALPMQVLGTSFSGSFQYDPQMQRTIETASFTFGPSDHPVFTVAFTITYAGHQLQSMPSVVDKVVTHHLPEEDQPALAIDLGGDWTPFPARLTSRTSLTLSMSFDQFLDMTNAVRLRERVLGSELLFSPSQLEHLRSIADRWRAHVRP